MCSSPELPDTLTAKNMLRDMIPCDDFHAMAAHVGFIPASPEVDHAEHSDSHRRCAAIEPVSGVISRLAANAGQLAAAMASCNEHGELPEEALAHYTSIAHFASFAVILQLLDFGYIGVAA